MLIWAVVVAGPLVLPASLMFGSAIPEGAEQALQTVGVVTLFLAICALDGLGTGSQKAHDGKRSPTRD